MITETNPGTWEITENDILNLTVLANLLHQIYEIVKTQEVIIKFDSLLEQRINQMLGNTQKQGNIIVPK